LAIGDCGVVSSPSSPKHIPVAVPATHAQAEGTTPSPASASAAVTEVPEELTTIIEVEEADIANGNETVDFVNLPGYGVIDDANTTANASVFSCYNRRYGYYADVGKKCLMFHLCYPVQEPTTGLLIFQRFSFVCSDNAVFDQQHLVCVDNDTLSYPCSESDKYFTESNNKLIESMQQNAQAYAQNGQPAGAAAATTGSESSSAPSGAEALVAEPVTAEASEIATNVTAADAETAAQYALLEQLFG
jgi:hypothetical protein